MLLARVLELFRERKIQTLPPYFTLAREIWIENSRIYSLAWPRICDGDMVLESARRIMFSFHTIEFPGLFFLFQIQIVPS